MKISTKAKINLSLDVLYKLPSGYHFVKMVMQTLTLSDEVTVEQKKGDIELYSNSFQLCPPKDNLAYKAARLFLDKCGIKNQGVEIYLDKHIPISAGLAGGSSNAAGVLILLNRLFETHLTQYQLMDIGREIGADVPYCIMGGTALAEGIGDVLTPLPQLPKAPVLLVTPDVEVSTKTIYHEIDRIYINKHPDTNSIIQAIYKRDFKSMCSLMYNVMEPITAAIHPEINKIKQEMMEHGALGAAMSGSGPTVFGIFEDEIYAEIAYNKLLENYEQVFLTEIG